VKIFLNFKKMVKLNLTNFLDSSTILLLSKFYTLFYKLLCIYLVDKGIYGQNKNNSAVNFL
jgi:hypothetical protein